MEEGGFVQIDDIAVGDEILASQWAEIHRSKNSTPEKNLLLACLTDSLRIIQKDKSEYRKHIELEWIRDTDASATFSFESICSHLGIDANWLRDAVLSGKMRRIPEHFINERPAYTIEAPRENHQKYSAA